MIKSCFSIAIFSLLCFSCNDKKIEVRHAAESYTHENLSQVKVVNSVDPVCKMPTKGNLNAIAIYKNERYGFCSESCKTKFLKEPEKYLTK